MRTTKIAVVGLGYVGLPLSFQFCRSGVDVLGLDIDTTKVEALSNGQSYIRHISAETVKDAVSSRKFSASTDFSRVGDHLCADTAEQKPRAGHFLHH